MCASKEGCLHRRSSLHFRKRRRSRKEEWVMSSYMKYLSSHSIMFEIPPISTYIHLLYHPIYTILYYKTVSCCEVVVCVFRTLCCEDFIYVRT
jgi:hypothetical protein